MARTGNGNGRSEKRIASAVTKRAFMHVELAEDIGKVRFFAGTYKSGQGMQASATHYMDADAAYVVFHDILAGTMGEYREYKGSRRNGEVVSRVLSINAREGNVYFEFVSGPGRETETGAILPVKGANTNRVVVALAVFGARKVAARVLAHLNRILARTYIDAPERSSLPEPDDSPFND